MLFAKGSRVRLKISGESGVVTDMLDKDLLMIRLDGQSMEIPVFEEDLEHVNKDNFKEIKTEGKVFPQEAGNSFPPVKSQYAILKSLGIQLAFDASSPNQYRIFLLNDTSQDYVFQFSWTVGGQIGIEKHGKIPAVSTLELGMMHMDELNDQPEATLHCGRITTDGEITELKKTIKIKAKTFFSKVMTAPLLNKPVHLFQVFLPDEPIKTATKEKEDLKTYTLRNAKPGLRPIKKSRTPSHDLEARAQFTGEIDLHIENLVESGIKRSNAEILRIQLAHFEKFIGEAIRLGAERVFIIHGLGKGKLRDEIASRLMQMPDVKTFQNNYHPRYGFGATEVIFR